MIITCPECSLQFAVPSNAIGKDGRKVKCSNCAHVWHQKPLEELADVSNIEEPPEKIEKIKKGSNLPSKIEKKTASLALKIAFALFLVFAMILEPLANPNENPDFAKMFGIQNTDGLAFKDFSVTSEIVDSKLNFVINGILVNEMEITMEVPDMHVRVLSKGGRIMQELDIAPPQRKMLAGEEMVINPEIKGVSGSAESIVLDIGNSWELSFR